jgi:hypothetical protein
LGKQEKESFPFENAAKPKESFPFENAAKPKESFPFENAAKPKENIFIFIRKYNLGLSNGKRGKAERSLSFRKRGQTYSSLLGNII